MIRRWALLLTFLTSLACSFSIPNAGMVSETPPPTPTNALVDAQKPIPSSPELGKSALVTAIQSLNVRERAGEYERVIGYLYHGNQVELSGACSDGWAEIEYVWTGGTTAWVNADFLSANKCSETEEEQR